ncbi:MAG: type III-B CRISPR module-associated Cmr3 family protein [Pelistega sp.]|nr:type III-B CRISPR module-associated Cmr3 family protein [Pelistega sp.]
MSQQWTVKFSPVDTWFFKESRNMDDSGAILMESLFPASIKTLLGAIRTYIGNERQIDWSNFSADSEFAKTIGYGEHDLGALVCNGFSLEKNGESHYAAPLNLVSKDGMYEFFEIGQAVQTDLGFCRLPEMKTVGGKPLENHYLSKTDWESILKGKLPSSSIAKTHTQLPGDRKKSDVILVNEPRLGIARNNQTGSVIQGMLYQTEHLRLQEGWSMSLQLQSSLPLFENQQSSDLIRLGGEGRLAHVEFKQAAAELPAKVSVTQNMLGVIIYLLTPLPDQRVDNQLPVLPFSDVKVSQSSQTQALQWEGSVGDLKIKVISAVVGKSIRLGGWDMKLHKSTPVRSFVPPGSCWYVQTESQEQAQQIIDGLHGQFLTSGIERQYGYGQVFVGLWLK